jgi:hypothetical protein
MRLSMHTHRLRMGQVYPPPAPPPVWHVFLGEWGGVKEVDGVCAWRGWEDLAFKKAASRSLLFFQMSRTFRIFCRVC